LLKPSSKAEKEFQELRLASWHTGQRVRARGLLGYPEPNSQDKQFIAAFERLLSSNPGVGFLLETPFTPVAIKTRVTDKEGGRMAYYLCCGDYLQHQLDSIFAHVRPGDRCLEAGGGIGVTAAAMGAASGQPVIAYEPNPNLERPFWDTMQLNNIQATLHKEAIVGIAAPGETQYLHITPEYWWSSLRERQEYTEALPVPVVGLVDVLDKYKPDVFFSDSELAEQLHVSRPLNHRPRTAFIEIHTPELGPQETCRIAQWWIDQGYKLTDLRAYLWTFERKY